MQMIDSKTYKVLKILYRNQRCTYEDISKITNEPEEKRPSKHISSLFTNRFISEWISDELVDCGGLQENKRIGYEITLAGEAYVQDRRRNGRNFWVPYLITTLIAIISLIVSLRT